MDRQPRILVLDEATSHLDVANEHSVNETVRSMGLTRLIVAHRPETIAMADRVLVMAGGGIAEERVKPVAPVTLDPAEADLASA